MVIHTIKLLEEKTNKSVPVLAALAFLVYVGATMLRILSFAFLFASSIALAAPDPQWHWAQKLTGANTSCHLPSNKIPASITDAAFRLVWVCDSGYNNYWEYEYYEGDKVFDGYVAVNYNETLGWYYSFTVSDMASTKYWYRIQGDKQMKDFHITNKKQCGKAKATVKVTRFFRDSSDSDTSGEYLVSYEIINIGSFNYFYCVE